MSNARDPADEAQKGYEPVTWKEIDEASCRPVEFVVQSLRVVKAVGILSGAGKVTKTTHEIAMAIHAIKGGLFAGQFECQKGNTVAWWDAENAIGSWGRKYRAVCKGMGIDPAELINSKRLVYFRRRGLYLDQQGVLEHVIESTKRTEASITVLDSLTRVHRQKEADSVSMSNFFVDSIFKIQEECCTGVNLIHHNRKNPVRGEAPGDDMRGAADLRNVVDTHLSLSRDRKDRTLFKAHLTAQRDAPDDEVFGWRMTWSPEGDKVTFAKLDDAEAAKVKAERKSAGRPPKQSDRARRLIVEAMRGKPALTWSEAMDLCAEYGIGRSTVTAAYGDARDAKRKAANA